MPDISDRKTTRRSLLESLKLSGPQPAEALAAPLGITTMAVRQHLYALRDEGLLRHDTRPGGRGRPAKIWCLTEAANRHFPDAHAELSVSLIELMRQTFGDDGMQKLLAARTADQIATYQALMDGATGLQERLERLAEIRTGEGYMAEAIPSDEGAWMLIERHCPICVAAASCTGICAAEMEVFRNVIGPGYAVTRTDHMLDGKPRCAYHITPERAG
ncbi:MAG: transcriptional regulator [Rhodospirillales bacterium]